MTTAGKTLPARAVDRAGETYGLLTVESRASNSPSGNAQWNCVCACGSRAVRTGSDLVNGRSKSCGCLARQATRVRHDGTRNLVGKTFGRLVVIAFAGLDNYPRATWSVRCSCGNELVVRGSHLQDGSTVSCGCRASDPRPGGQRSDITYASAHHRVTRLHGLASSHACVDCGGKARDWAYDHQDQAQRRDDRGRPYSLDPSHYRPLCRRCHKNFDNTTSRVVCGDPQEGEIA